MYVYLKIEQPASLNRLWEKIAKPKSQKAKTKSIYHVSAMSVCVCVHPIYMSLFLIDGVFFE